MKIYRYFILLTILFSSAIFGQNFDQKNRNFASQKDSIYGTLTLPHSIDKPILVILVPGSGPTDRNGNQGMIQNNSLKFLAEALAQKGFASYRFDQTVIAQAKLPDFKEENYSFSGLVEEVRLICTQFKKEENFSKIVIAGHSQGSLVGMLATPEYADAFISLNGAGQSIDKILYEQLNNQVPQLEESFSKTLKQLKNGEKVTDFNPMLYSLFRPSVQPFLIDWMQYDPQVSITKIKVPVLIIGGTKDIQVSVHEAQLMNQAAQNSKIVIIENMNHLFKEIKGGDAENQMSYMKPEMPIMNQLVDEIEFFLKGI